MKPLPAARPVIVSVVLAGLPGLCAAAQRGSGQGDGTKQGEFYRLVKRFDFDERPLGNYQQTPMHWVRLAGPGLPTYARGQFDEQVGHQAPPSFRLDLTGGNVAYEYRQGDLAVIPGSDYRVQAWVRTRGLEYARAFMEAYLVDRYDEAIPGSTRLSGLVCSDPAGGGSWRHLQIDLPGDFPTAYALRLRLWVLQSYVWREPDESAVDPIIRRDIHASAWFDDITVHRLPRARLRLSNPGNIVGPRAREFFVLQFNSATAHGLEAELSVADSSGRICHTQRAAVPSALNRSGWRGDQGAGRPGPAQAAAFRAASSVRVPVPPLPAGVYQARLRVVGAEQTLLTRQVRFAVLPELGGGGWPHGDLGVDLGPWRGGDAAGMAELLAALGCGAVKIGIPLVSTPASPEQTRYFREISELVRRLSRQGIEATGVMLTPSAAADPAQGLATRRLIANDSGWRRRLSPILARFSGLLPAWQLGAEQIELRDGGRWDPQAVAQVREHLGRFVTLPEVVVPYEVLDPPPAAGDRQSIWVPAQIPARSLPEQLAFLARPAQARRWLTLGRDRRPGLGRRQRLADLARRIVLAKALAPERVFVPAPFELTRSGGGPSWQPSEEYVVLRTLFRALSGKRAVGALRLGAQGVAVIFQGAEASCLAAWTWRQTPARSAVGFQLGHDLRATDLWARPLALAAGRAGTRLALGPLPTLLFGVDAPLALLQASLHLEPMYLELHQARLRPVLSFRNPYRRPISGTLSLRAPAGWAVLPPALSFELGPGETFRRALELVIPPRQVASRHQMGVHVSLNGPPGAELELAAPVVIGLKDIVLEAETSWAGDDLVVEQVLRNVSARPVSFTAFCQAPARPRAEQEFLRVAPGATARRVYRFEDARDLAGLRLHLGIQEIRGRRALDQLVEVPP